MLIFIFDAFISPLALLLRWFELRFRLRRFLSSISIIFAFLLSFRLMSLFTPLFCHCFLYFLLLWYFRLIIDAIIYRSSISVYVSTLFISSDDDYWDIYFYHYWCWFSLPFIYASFDYFPVSLYSDYAIRLLRYEPLAIYLLIIISMPFCISHYEPPYILMIHYFDDISLLITSQLIDYLIIWYFLFIDIAYFRHWYISFISLLYLFSLIARCLCFIIIIDIWLRHCFRFHVSLLFIFYFLFSWYLLLYFIITIDYFHFRLFSDNFFIAFFFISIVWYIAIISWYMFLLRIADISIYFHYWCWYCFHILLLMTCWYCLMPLAFAAAADAIFTPSIVYFAADSWLLSDADSLFRLFSAAISIIAIFFSFAFMIFFAVLILMLLLIIFFYFHYA